MKVMVFDVPAETGGALTILNKYYNLAIKEKGTEWIFIVSTPKLKEHKNIKILNYPWIKKSWLHRLYFDRFIAHKLVKKYRADEVLSLQNIVIPKVNVKQTLYLHQALPFVEKRYKITENLKFWLYQNIISRLIFKSIKKADKIIVQTNWIKTEVLKKVDVSKEKFIVKQPELTAIVKKVYKFEDKDKKLFFYPASGAVYKNHDIIVKACRKLKEIGLENYKVIFTLKGDENNYVRRISEITARNNLPIKFIGRITIDEVYEYYSKSTLIFPSYIETFGLPLLEAKMHESPIIASDCAFSHEILDGYNKVKFFDPFDENALYLAMIDESW